MEFFRHNKIYDFVKWSNYGIILSAIFFVGSLFLFFNPGFSLGVDFAVVTIFHIQYIVIALFASV